MEQSPHARPPHPRPAAPGADAPRLCVYLALYHEAVCANLAEQALLWGDAAQRASEDALAELADFAVRAVRRRARRMQHRGAAALTGCGAGDAPDDGRVQGSHGARDVRVPLATRACVRRAPAALTAARARRSPKALLEAAPGTELGAGARDARLAASFSGLTALRVLAQHASELPPCVRERLLRAADAPAALLRLLAARPWARMLPPRAPGGAPLHQSFAGGAWADEPPRSSTHAQNLHLAEAQAWLALVALLSDASGGEGAGVYPAASRARALASARRLLAPRVLDALPALVWLSRAAEQADAMQPEAHGDSGGPSMLLLQSVPPWRERLLGATDWAAVVAAAAAGVFGDTPAAAAAAAREATAAAALWDEALVLPEEADGGALGTTGPPGAPHLPAAVRVSFARRAGGATWAVAWEATLHADALTAPVEVSLRDTAGAAVTGHRWRLLPPSAPRRIPPAARVSCSLGAADALVELPAPPVAPGGAAAVEEATWRAAPAVVWATLGSLARDGFALQLRLARVDSAAAAGVDGVSGCASLYRLAGGALTLRAPAA